MAFGPFHLILGDVFLSFFLLTPGVDCLWPPKDILVLTWNLWTFPYGKRGFVHVIELRMLRWRDDPRLSQWALNAITSVLISERQKEIWLWKKAMWALKQDAIPLALKMEEGTTNQEIQGMQANSRIWKRRGNGFYPEPLESTQPCWLLDFGPVKLIWSPDFQNY